MRYPVGRNSFQKSAIWGRVFAPPKTLPQFLFHLSHGGKCRHLGLKNFSGEMALRFNLGRIHQSNSFISEILEVLKRSETSFIRKENHVGCISSGDLDKSAAVNTFHKKQEEKSRFHRKFWLEKQATTAIAYHCQLHTLFEV